MKLRYLLIHVAYGDRRVDAEDFTPMISFLIVLTPERPQKGGPVNDDNYDQGLRKKKKEEEIASIICINVLSYPWKDSFTAISGSAL